MPVYFLHTINGMGAAPDDEGREFADLEAARAEAIDGVRSMLSSEARQGRFDLRGRIEIADESGATLAVVRFREAFEIELDDDP